MEKKKLVKPKKPSKSKEKFYVTTPIYYPNDIPHIGHAYTTLAADVLARWNKLLGKDVFFLTGTDEHGKKLEKTAQAKGKTPKEFIDALIPEFKSAWKKLNANYDYFIRTTDKDHEKVIQEVLQKCFDNGDIYLGSYEGLYCVGCEAYYTEKDLVEGCCPIHKKPVEKLNEESYFFKLSKYQKKLLELYKKNKEFVLPDYRANEVISRVKEGLQDLSISRTSFNWGIPLPFNKKHICYVWFDALFNYYSATRQKGKEKYWPADVHLVGKDILWFHAVYWPAFLMSAGIELPKTVFAHGWWTFDKEKISKSVGKVINVDELISIAGVDSARYFLFRNTAFGQDGDFSEKALIDRHNNELANKLGNLVSRVSALAESYGLQKCENKLIGKLNLKNIEKLYASYEFDKVLSEIFTFIDVTNEYVQTKKPWETKDKKVLYELVDSIKSIAILLSPFIPETCDKIAEQLGFEIKYENIEENLDYKKIVKGEILFKKIEISKDSKTEGEGFVIKESKINGKGLFANRDFKKGEPVIPLNKEAKYLSEEELKKLSDDLKKYVAIYNNKYLLIASPERHLNHSCNPNVETRENGIEYAIKDIKEGEELTGDYTKVKTLIGFNCNCGNKNCKKIIESFSGNINKQEIPGIITMADMIKYDDFAKLDLRVGTIKKVEDIEGADKLFKLTVDLGKEIGQRTILAGIKKYYKKEELAEKQIIVIANLEYRKMKGQESQGMLLAAGSAENNTCILISPEKKTENGMKIN